jgi:hypothetical protein
MLVGAFVTEPSLDTPTALRTDLGGRGFAGDTKIDWRVIPCDQRNILIRKSAGAPLDHPQLQVSSAPKVVFVAETESWFHHGFGGSLHASRPISKAECVPRSGVVADSADLETAQVTATLQPNASQEAVESAEKCVAPDLQVQPLIRVVFARHKDVEDGAPQLGRNRPDRFQSGWTALEMLSHPAP